MSCSSGGLLRRTWNIRPRSHGSWGNIVTTTLRVRLVTLSTPKSHVNCSPTFPPRVWPEGLKSWILGLKTPKLLGQALNDLAGLRPSNPLFEGLTPERRAEACGLLMVSAVNMVRGKVWKQLAPATPILRPLCFSGVLATTVTSSTIPGIKAVKDLLWVLEYSGVCWAGVPLMVMSMLPDLTPADHPDRLYVGAPPKAALKAPRVMAASGGSRGLFSLLKITEPSALYLQGDSVSPAPTPADAVPEEPEGSNDPGIDACLTGCSSPVRA